MYNRGPGNTTIKDVAALAGVSIGTVSRVIHNKGYISEPTRQKVLEAITETQFIPNINAQTASEHQAPVVGVIVPEITNPFLSYLVSYIEKYLNLENYSVMLCNNLYSAEKTKKFIDRLLQYRVRGLFMIATKLDDRDYLEMIREKLSIVCINTIMEKVDCINCADWQTTFELTEHLISLGHRDIAYMGFNHTSPPTLERLRGFQDAMMKHHLPIREEYLQGTDVTMRPIQNLRDGNHAPANVLASRLLDLPNPPTAIMAINDYYALGIYTECHKRGLQVGRDISVAGYDDIPLTEIMTPPVTSVHCDVDSMAYIATSTLVDRIKSKEHQQLDSRNILVPGSLRLRASTASPVTARHRIYPDR